MRKKVLSMILAIALVVTLFPLQGAKQVEAAGTYFIFSDLGDAPDSPTMTNDQQIDLTGTYNSVSESSIVYTVEQILDTETSPMKVGLSRENTTAGLSAIDGNISVVGLELFSGLNKITFSGQSGYSELSDTFYIEYIDNPVIYDLQFLGSDGNYTLDSNKVVVTENMTSQTGTGKITLQGQAPNADEVFVYINEDYSKSFPVVNDTFFASGLQLEQGSNEVKFVVSNDDQNVETTKEFVYFNGDATFFDIELNGSDLGDNPTITAGDGASLLLSGKVVVPNYYVLKPEAPVIESAFFEDVDGSGDWSDGDTLTITFDVDTNEASPGGLDVDVDVNDLIDWDADGAGVDIFLGEDYHADWTDAKTLVVTVEDATNNNVTTALIGSTEEIGIKSSADLLTDDELSDPSDSSSQLTGSISDVDDTPYLVSAIAVDGSNSPGLEDYDEIVLTFSKPTNMLGRAVGQTVSQSQLDNALNYSNSLGTSYYGIWDDNQTLRIVIADHGASTFTPGTDWMQLKTGIDGIKDPTETIDAEFSTSQYIVRGSFGVSASAIYEPHPDPASLTTEDEIEIEIYGLGQGSATINVADIISSPEFYVSTPQNDDEYFVFEFEDVAIGTIDSSGEDLASNEFDFDQLYSFIFNIRNYVKSAAYGQPIKDSQSGFSFTLRDSGAPFVEDVRYITNMDTVEGVTNDYDDLNATVVTGNNFEVFEAPFDLELMANMDVSGDSVVISVLDENGVEIMDTASFTSPTYFTVISNTTTSGVNTSKFIRINQLPRVGYQVLRIKIGSGPEFDQPITYVFGPYATFDKLYNGMLVEDPDDPDTSEYGVDQLDFSGKLWNVDPATIISTSEATPTSPQTIFLTINGKNIDISDNDDGTFYVDNTDAQGELNAGQNNIVFTYSYGSEYYKRTVIINVFPTDYPEVPAEGSSGIFPSTYSTPTKDPDNFIELSEGMYSTTEKSFSVYGSFRLLEMDNISSTLATINNDQYRFEIQRNGETIVEWDLYENEFETDNGTDYGSTDIANFDVVYDRSEDYFTFELSNQTVEDNTGTIVYTFVAYKETANTFYRMEIQTIDTPYIILRPFLPEQKVINQNYLDVVIYSENAESVVIDDFVGEKFDFDEDNDGDIDFVDAFKIRVKDLKENKENDIEFTITLDSGEEVEGSFTVYYATTSITGAQYIAEMDRKIEAFDEAIELEFPRNTVLTNDVDPTDTDAIQRLYANHEILMGIANPYNGLVDARIYEEQPSGFKNKIALSELEFNATLPERFTMASPLYWIDAGLADDPSTLEFDPYESGMLPFQFPDSGLPSYMERDEDRVLVPTQRGELTLQFDEQVVDFAGTQISVFRYDPILQMWENIGGQVDTKNNTITVPFDQFGYYAVMKLQYSFVDITSHPYARDEMDAIYSKGVMLSFDDQDFGANNNITRGEFAAMVIRALQIPLNYDDQNLHFDDVSTVIVPGALWDYRYIETAAREGIIHGMEPRIFNPYSELTREQAAVILARALELKMEVNDDKMDEALSEQFQDYSSIYRYARAAVLAVVKEGLMEGSYVDPTDPDAGYVFEPTDNLLRSDAAMIMTRLMAERKLLPEMN